MIYGVGRETKNLACERDSVYSRSVEEHFLLARKKSQYLNSLKKIFLTRNLWFSLWSTNRRHCNRKHCNSKHCSFRNSSFFYS